MIALFGVGNALWAFEQPDAGAGAGEVVAFYADTSTEIVVGASLSLFAIALFVLFASGVRAILREREEDDLFASAAFGGALLAMAAGLGAETINMVGALRADAGQLSPELGRALFEISYILGYNGAGVGIGIFALASAVVALRSRAVLPRWLALLLLALGIAFLTPISRFLLAPSLLLLAVVSVSLVRSSHAEVD
ncbi:MAG TPA: hypothetical protein VFT19_09015 [Solirubrobacterales bacterium]|nr:hypothetical protein [Solirubrobacterales bacterium]